MAATALLLKEGHMAMSKAPDFEPPSPRNRGADRQAQTAAIVRNRMGSGSWRCAGTARRTPLYRPPRLPVVAGSTLNEYTVSVQKYRDDTRDWRLLSVAEVASTFKELEASLEPSRSPQLYPTPFRRDPELTRQFEGLLVAIAVGTLQVCNEASSGDVRMPMSRLFDGNLEDVYLTEDVPLQKTQALTERPSIKVMPDMSPLAVCAKVSSERHSPPIGLVRFVPAGDARAQDPALTDYRESQLYLRTSFLHALREMGRHIHKDPTEALGCGAVVLTTDVSILRGPVELGAEWLATTPSIHVISAALQRNPRCDGQGQYARINEKAAVAETIDRIFACAIANGIEVLVFPPLGVAGSASCAHPAADAGDLLRKAYLANASRLSRVYVCQEYPGQLRDSTWATLAAALENGRQALEHSGLVPLTSSPYVRPGWEQKTPRHKCPYPPWPAPTAAAPTQGVTISSRRPRELKPLESGSR